MRVAVLAHSFPRFAGDTHGVFVQRLSEELARLGHRVWVLVPHDPALQAERDGPLRIRSFRYVWPPGWHLLGYSRTLRRDVRMRPLALLLAPLYLLAAPRALRRLVRQERIELVHAHWILPNGFVAWRVRRATGVPYAVTLHGSDVFLAERNPVLSWMASRALAGAGCVTSPSPDLRDRLLALAPGAAGGGKISLVPNGTDLPPPPPREEVEALRRRLGAGPGDPLIAAVGRLVDKKGFRYLLAAAPEVLAAHPRARIAVGGGGDLEGRLRRQAEELGIADRVAFTGPLSHREVLGLLAAADLFVMPSVRDARGNVDGLPVVVLEAMAAGKPVVASRIAGLPLAVEEGATGLLVPEKDPQALAAALRRLLEDPARTRRLGEAGRERVRRELNWPAVARTHDALYRQLVGGSEAGEERSRGPTPESDR